MIRRFNDRGVRAFTMVELLAAMVILSILMGIIFAMVSQTSSLWKSTNSKIGTFQNVRAAFESITRNLSQATLNSYYDYYDSSWQLRPASSASFVPVHYGRRSELQFISGPVAQVFAAPDAELQGHAVFFQAPLGRVADGVTYGTSADLMNVVGYYVAFSKNPLYDKRPKFLQGVTTPHPRYQLIECIQPAEKLRVFDTTLQGAAGKDWFTTPVTNGDQCRVMAENIVALVIQPKLNQNDTSLAPEYFYNSRPATYDLARSHLLPPIVQVTLVAIDEESAMKLERAYGNATPPLMTGELFVEADKYASDLATLESRLNGEKGGPKLNYRTFSTTVNLRSNQ